MENVLSEEIESDIPLCLKWFFCLTSSNAKKFMPQESPDFFDEISGQYCMQGSHNHFYQVADLLILYYL
ncbi:MAG: hypothetical protein RR397_08550, partial [Odoribacter sp.]